MFEVIPILEDLNVYFEKVPSSDEIVVACPVCKRENHFYYNVKKNLCVCHRCKWESNSVGYLVALGYTLKDAMSTVFGSRRASVGSIRQRISTMLNEEESEEIDWLPVFFRTPIPKTCSEISRNKFPVALSERKISFKIVDNFKIKRCDSGYYGNRIIFPISTLKTRTFIAHTAFTKRKFKKVKSFYEKKGDNFKKTIIPNGSYLSEVLFLYNLFKESRNDLFLVEGAYDTLRMIRFGENSMGLLHGAVSTSQSFLISETKAERIFLMLDGDVPLTKVVKYTKLLKNICFDKEIRACLLPSKKDPDNSMNKQIKEVIKKSMDTRSLERFLTTKKLQ